MTHSQRCRTTVMVRELTAPFVMQEALAAIDRVLVRTCNTLSRDAELACVYRAHRAAQLIEDAVCASVMAVSGLWAPRIPFRSIDAQARSAESIHEFDLRASLVMTAEDARLLTARVNNVAPGALTTARADA